MVLATLVLAAVLPLDAKPDAVGDALRARDSLSRTTAARIAAVRDLKSLAPALREALAKESDANVAREEIRALVLLGGDEDVAVAADATKRFPAPIDEAFSNAVARLGAPRAIDLYFAHVASMREIDGFFELALWRRPDLVTSTASRLIGAKDERGFVNLTVALNEAKLAINADIIAIALQSELPKIREAAVWHVVENFVDDPSRIAKSVRDVVPYSGAMEIREAFGRELLKRMLGGEPAKIEGSLAWLEKYRSWGTAMLALMSTEEREATRSPLPEAPKGKTPSAPVRRPSFTLPAELPAGLADAVIKETGCRGSWLGVASATIDAQGRVTAVDVSSVQADRDCRRALSTLMHLSFATPYSMRATLTTNELLAVKANGEKPCLDERSALITDAASGTRRVGGDVTAPTVIRRVNPVFAESARAAMGKGNNVVVIAEAIISTEGCVRNIRLISQAPHPEINAAAVLALSKWKFTPGKLNGIPVDVIFYLNVNFKIP